jgi:hypothetical protein
MSAMRSALSNTEPGLRDCVAALVLSWAIFGSSAVLLFALSGPL